MGFLEHYRGKRVFITGGSSGIGLATARLLVRAGAHVWIAARGRERLDAARRELESLRVSPEQRIGAVAVDVSRREEVERAAARVLDGLGGLDLLVNNAGISRPGYLHEQSPALFEETIRVNYLGVVNTTLAFLPHFREQRSGWIANTSSTLGFLGIFGYAAYAASKFAIRGFSECIRQDLLPYGVGVSVLYPSDTDTPQFHEENRTKPPETRAISGTIRPVPPETVARALLRGVARRRFTIVPGLLNRLTIWLARCWPGLFRWIIDGSLRRSLRERGGEAGRAP